MKNTRFRTHLVLLLLVLGGALPSGAVAQGALDAAEPTGTISGTLGDSTLQWNTLEIPVEGEIQSTATYNVMMDMFYNFSLQAHQDRSLVEGTVSLDFSSMTGPLTDCPCELTGDITYWTTTAMLEDMYIGNNATVTVLEVEELSNGDLRLVGTAEGQLHFHENVMSQEPPTGDPISVALQFEIDTVRLVELDF